MKIDDIEIDFLSEWVFRLIEPLRFINNQMAKSEPIQSFVTRVWSLPLVLMLIVDLASMAFAGLNVIDSKEVIAVVTVTNFLRFIVEPLITWALLLILRAKTPLRLSLSHLLLLFFLGRSSRRSLPQILLGNTTSRSF